MDNKRQEHKHIPAGGNRPTNNPKVSGRPSPLSPLSVAGSCTLCMAHVTMQAHTHLVQSTICFSGYNMWVHVGKTCGYMWLPV